MILSLVLFSTFRSLNASKMYTATTEEASKRIEIERVYSRHLSDAEEDTKSEGHARDGKDVNQKKRDEDIILRKESYSPGNVQSQSSLSENVAETSDKKKRSNLEEKEESSARVPSSDNLKIEIEQPSNTRVAHEKDQEKANPQKINDFENDYDDSGEQNSREVDEIHQDPAEVDSSEETRQQSIAKINSLRQRNRELYRFLQGQRDFSEQAAGSLKEALRKRNKMLQALDTGHRARVRVEGDLKQFKDNYILLKKTIRYLNSQIADTSNHIKRLKNKQNNVIRDKAHLVEDFRAHGIENWVESSMKGSVNPVVLDAITQGAGYVVEPVLDGIEKLATVNDELANTVSKKLRDRVPLAQHPFYSGFVAYMVLLCPLVIVMSILTKITSGFSRLTIVHFITLGTVYFALLTAGCLIAMVLGSVDVLLTLRHQNIHLFDFMMVLHGLLYLAYVGLHACRSMQNRSKISITHFLFVTAIGVHFFSHLRNGDLGKQDSYVDKWAHVTYNAVFFFVLYEMIFKREGRKRDLSAENRKGDRQPDTSQRCVPIDIEARLGSQSSPISSGADETRALSWRTQTDLSAVNV